jgi:hypothetical protein
MGDGDTWWHLETGDWILQHGAIPRVDPFSFTMAGSPWTAHEWLSELWLALAYRAAGWSGVALLTGAAAASAVLIVSLRLARDLTNVPFFCVATLSFSLLPPSFSARPHIFALPVIAAWTVGLLSARDADRAPSLWLTPLMALWANLHGGFAFGIALVIPFAIEAVIAAPAARRVVVAKEWGLFAVLTIVAALCTPHGFAGLLFPFQLLGIASLASVGEWQPQNFAHPGPMEFALLALLGFALLRPISVPILRVLLLVGLIHLSLQHARHEMLLGIVAPMLLAGPIARAIGEPPAGAAGVWRQPALLAVALSALLIAGLRIAWPPEPVDGPCAPISALAATPADLREKPVLNDYNFGGYLIRAKVRSFVDGRTDMFGDAFLNLYRQLSSSDPSKLESVLARYKIAWTILSPDRPLVALMDREPGWRRLYADSYAVVHVRTDAPVASTPAEDGRR